MGNVEENTVPVKRLNDIKLGDCVYKYTRNHYGEPILTKFKVIAICKNETFRSLEVTLIDENKQCDTFTFAKKNGCGPKYMYYYLTKDAIQPIMEAEIYRLKKLISNLHRIDVRLFYINKLEEENKTLRKLFTL